ncbi:replication initiation factor domain-containing protein [Pseudomonas sp. S 311-6]|uniref:replication initiation factor domain-containing protein n=1 Tax=Kerstersia gyiorum TaxID=206506 RepID=UPI0020977FCD|nr:replication initiation factor domain-containing protein [Pseudomonas sp. S 311-6]
MTHRLTKDEKLVLEGRRVKMTLAQAQATSKDRCSVDWLSTTIKGTDLFNSLFWTLSNEHHEGEFVTEVQVMAILAKKVAAITGFQVGDLRPGRNHYDSTLRILNDEGEEVGSVSGGGVYQRDTYLIMLNGSGCTFAKAGWRQAMYDFLVPLNARLSRIDIALDFFEGGCGGVEGVREACMNGGFDYHGRRPQGRTDGYWDAGHSRSYYVGRRGAKLVNAYDKGHAYKDMESSWWRIELRYWSQDRILPLECLIEPDTYFAGAHPYMQELLDVSEAIRIKTKPKLEDVTTDAVVKRKLRWLETTVAPSLVHLTRAFDAGLEGMAWIGELIEKHAARELPRSLRTVPNALLKQGIQRILKPAEPASVAA